MIGRMSHTTIYVLDQEEALRFYTEKLGFRVHTDITMGDFRWLTVQPPDQPDLQIILSAIKPGGAFSEEAAAHLRAVIELGALGMGVFYTADCRATYADLSARGVEFVSPPEEQPYGIEAILKDNSGNWFSLTQQR